jgi:hypothetical protein
MDTQLALGLVWFLAFLFSTTVHEAMHAFVAWKGGDPTAYHGGQVSLSPIPHIKREPIGMLVVPLLTSLTQGWAMGWASAPYDPLWAERHPQRAALMASAGPAGNFMIALVAFAGLRAGLLTGLVRRSERAAFHHVVADAGTVIPTYLERCCRYFWSSTSSSDCSICCRSAARRVLRRQHLSTRENMRRSGDRCRRIR